MEFMMTTPVIKLTRLLTEDFEKEPANKEDTERKELCAILLDALNDPGLNVIHYKESEVDYKEYLKHNFKFTKTTAFVDDENADFVYIAIKAKRSSILVFVVAMGNNGYTVMPYMGILTHVYDKFNVELLKTYRFGKKHRKSTQELLYQAVRTIISITCHSNTTKH